MQIDKITSFRNRTCETIDKLSVLAAKNRPDEDFFPIGFPLFDSAMDGGVRGGELITVSAQTGEGKSSWCQQVSTNLSKNGVPSLWLSYEMGLYYLQEKFKKITEDDLSIYAPKDLISNEISIIKEWIDEASEEKACKVVFIDHLHYLIPLSGVENSSMLVGAVVRGLKRLAIETNTIIFLIAHTKKIYQGEELNLSSIRDSSLVAQESDYVFLIKREKKPVGGKMDGNEGSTYLNESTIYLAKNRRKGELLYLKCFYENGVFKPIITIYAEKDIPLNYFDGKNY